MTDKRPTRVVIVGQGYVGLPLAMRAVEVGHDVVGFDVDHDRVKRLSSGRVLRRGRHRRRARGRPRHRPLPAHDATTDGLRRLRRRRHHGARRRCARAIPTSRYIEESAARARPVPPARAPPSSSSRPPTRAPPRSWSAPDPRGGLGPDRRRRLPPRLQPGAHRPRQPDLEPREHAEGRLRHRRRVARGRAGASTTRIVERDGAGVGHAARRPSSPSCSRTPSGTSTSRSSTSWRCSPATSASTSGRRSTPRPPSRSATCGSRPGPGVGGHCLPIDPSYLSWRVKRALGQTLPLRRAGQRRQRPHARLRRAPAHGRARTSERKAVNGSRASCCSGSAYKKNTGDARESPAMVVADRLLALGAHVRAADPHVLAEQVDRRIALVEVSDRRAAAADAVVRPHRSRHVRLRRLGAGPLRAGHEEPGHGRQRGAPLALSTRRDRTGRWALSWRRSRGP